MPNMDLKKSPMPVQDPYARITNFDEAMRRNSMYKAHEHEAACNLFKKEVE